MHVSFGALDLPLDAGDFSTSLASLDPVRDRLLGLFEAAINAELGDVWAKVTATLGANHALRDTSPVEQTLKLAPDVQTMTQGKSGFPLLALHRTGEAQYSDYTFEIDRCVQQWHLHYILGPLEVANARKLLDVCAAIPKLIRWVIQKQGHPAYENGALQFFDGTGSLAAIDLKSHEGPGQALYGGGDDGTRYWAVVMTLETVELSSESEDAYGSLDAVTIKANLSSEDGVIPVFVEGHSDELGESES